MGESNVEFEGTIDTNTDITVPNGSNVQRHDGEVVFRPWVDRAGDRVYRFLRADSHRAANPQWVIAASFVFSGIMMLMMAGFMRGFSMQLDITNSEKSFARQLDAVSWGLFIIWIGVAILLDIGWGWGLLGVAAIILGAAAIRWFKALPVEGFWLAAGLMLLACAVWEFFAVSLPLIPLLIIGFGVVVLARAFRRPQPRTH